MCARENLLEPLSRDRSRDGGDPFSLLRCSPCSLPARCALRVIACFFLTRPCATSPASPVIHPWLRRRPPVRLPTARPAAAAASTSSIVAVDATPPNSPPNFGTGDANLSVTPPAPSRLHHHCPLFPVTRAQIQRRKSVLTSICRSQRRRLHYLGRAITRYGTGCR
jgi:hypothetical protein